MNFSKYVLLSSLSLLSCSVLLADLTPGEGRREDDDEQFRAIHKYIESKRDITIAQKGGNLKIGGEVKVTYGKQHQVLDGERVEGKGQGGDRGAYGALETDIPAQYGKVEAALSLDYRNDRSFANILIRMANTAGLDTTNYSDITKLSTDSDHSRLEEKSNYSPTKNRLDLARAYIGYDLWESESHKLVANLGRQRLYDLFDSRVMFVNRFDGLALKYTGAFDGIGHGHATAGTFLISDRVNHYGNVMELGLNHIVDSGFGLKYSIIDWSNGRYSDMSNRGEADDESNNWGTNQDLYAYLNEAFRYTVSQVTATYEVPMDWTYGQKVKLYAAFLHNHRAVGMKDFYAHHDHDRKNNTAWYAGFTVGRIAAPDDWVFDLCYQYVEPQSVPDFDSFGGAGRGNLTSVWGVLDHSQGNNNYEGFQAKFAYLVNPALLVKLNAAHSRAADAQLSSINNLARSGVFIQDPTTGTGTRSARNKWDSMDIEFVYSF